MLSSHDLATHIPAVRHQCPSEQVPHYWEALAVLGGKQHTLEMSLLLTELSRYIITALHISPDAVVCIVHWVCFFHHPFLVLCGGMADAFVLFF